MTHRPTRLALALLLAAIAGCGLSPRADFDDVRVSQRVEEANVQQDPVVLAHTHLIRLAESAVLHEGLPHQKSEEVLLKQERSRVETTDLDGFAFYRETLPLSDGDRHKIQAILGDPQTYGWWDGEKGCCVYHPDYCLEWYAEGQTFQTFLCFGCGEARLVGPEGKGHYSLAYDARMKLAQVLFPYRKNRPDSAGWQELLNKHQ